MWAIPNSVPLYRCSACGFVTTASLDTALSAHSAGATDCPGELELAADFRKAPVIRPSLGRAKSRKRPVVADASTKPSSPQRPA